MSAPSAEPRYATVKAFETALTTRLKALITPQRTFQDLRKELAFDRVLARLVKVSPGIWLLKGGVALEYRFQQSARATSDIDISVRGTVDSLSEALQAAASLEMRDYFSIRLGGSSRPVDEIETYRFSIDVLYENGRPFERVSMDVGFADPWLGEAQTLVAPPLLDFIQIAPTRVRAIPIVQHLAEKLHANTKQYGTRGSTRVKDLVDMALLLEAAPIDDKALAEMIKAVFSARNTHPIPKELPPPPADWHGPYARLARGLPVPQTSDAAYAYVSGRLSAALSIANR